ncbi:MAG: 50S ribosomal protein L25/general stress protein Ctc [Steroidobacteraceae bacterium]
MKTSFELVADYRNDQGKGASRRLRRDGKVPAILYGGGSEPRSLALDHTKLQLMLDNERFYTTILSIKVGGDSQSAILRDIQRHPCRNQIVHIDFQRVRDDEKLRVSVPFHFVNQATAPGVKTQGGIVSHLRNEVEISCFPKDLPEYIEVDMGAMQLNDALHLSDIKVPAGVEFVDLTHDRDPAIVSIHSPRAEETAEAAPAAEAAAPAAEAKKEEPKKDAKK